MQQLSHGPPVRFMRGEQNFGRGADIGPAPPSVSYFPPFSAATTCGSVRATTMA
jgi:hypothetical protein